MNATLPLGGGGRTSLEVAVTDLPIDSAWLNPGYGPSTGTKKMQRRRGNRVKGSEKARERKRGRVTCRPS